MAQAQPTIKTARTDRELEDFRQLMSVPSTFEDGFSWAAFLGALFVAILMVPGSIYMSLLAEQSVGPAAQWVTLILFIEVARRANKPLKRAEIFTLFYIAGAIMAAPSSVSGGFHGGLGVLWSQFYVQSTAAQAANIADKVPDWVAPNDPNVLAQRSLLMWEWVPAIALGAFTMIIGRIDNMVLGYGLFRLTSDIEKLPFPMAPLGAQGILALSEEQEEEGRRKGAVAGEEIAPAEDKGPKSWRWRVFSIGSVIGLVFGAVYLGLPTITGALLTKPITILPIPFVDYTTTTAGILPAVAIGISLNLGSFLLGMVLPFYAIVGTFIGFIVTMVLNPILYNGGFIAWFTDFRGGVLSSWNPGDNLQATFYKNNIDFYFSFSIGISLAIAVMGIWAVVKGIRDLRRQRRLQREAGVAEGDLYAVPAGRGDIRAWLIFLTYLVSTSIYISVSMWLLWVVDGKWHNGVFLVMLGYGFLYTPLISYVTARLEGIAGQVINIPFVKEASFILSGYRGVAVWFLPVPLHNYGQMTVFYRQCELTGTKFASIWKAEVLLTPIVLIGSLAFAHFIWTLGEIPGPQYPYASEWWEVTAEQQSIVFSSTLGGFTVFEQALRGLYIGVGFIIALVLFLVMGWFGAPTFLMYGVVRGLNQTLPFVIFSEIIGAMIGRYYFQKRMGLVWRQYIPVIMAGFSCGMGLIGTLGIGFTFLAKAVFKLPF